MADATPEQLDALRMIFGFDIGSLRAGPGYMPFDSGFSEEAVIRPKESLDDHILRYKAMRNSLKDDPNNLRRDATLLQAINAIEKIKGLPPTMKGGYRRRGRKARKSRKSRKARKSRKNCRN